MADRSGDSWLPTTAYFYVLHLDGLALAWEYLRRHPDYRSDWLRRRRRPEAAHRWGLRLWEDPSLDARDAHPAWFPDHDAVFNSTRMPIHLRMPADSSFGVSPARNTWFTTADA